MAGKPEIVLLSHVQKKGNLCVSSKKTWKLLGPVPILSKLSCVFFIAYNCFLAS